MTERMFGWEWPRGCQIIAKDSAELRFAVANFCFKKFTDHCAKEKPPELQHALDIV